MVGVFIRASKMASNRPGVSIWGHLVFTFLPGPPFTLRWGCGASKGMRSSHGCRISNNVDLRYLKAVRKVTWQVFVRVLCTDTDVTDEAVRERLFLSGDPKFASNTSGVRGLWRTKRDWLRANWLHRIQTGDLFSSSISISTKTLSRGSVTCFEYLLPVDPA